MGPFRHRLLLGPLVLIALGAPSVGSAQLPSPSPDASAAPAPSRTPVPERVGFEAIPARPGTGTEPGGLAWIQVLPPLPEGRHLWSVMTWAGGFAAIEWADRRHRSDVAVAVWRSLDGVQWHRAALPQAVRNAYTLVAQVDDLVLAVGPAQRSDDGFRAELWRSGDGTRWRRSGTFERTLPRSKRAAWELHWLDLRAVRGRIVLLTATRPQDDGAGGRAPIGPRLATGGAVSLAQRAPRAPSAPRGEEHMTAWSSRTGDHWVGRRVRGVTSSTSGIFLDIQGSARGFQLAAGGGATPGLLRSENGWMWDEVAPLPPMWSHSGSSGMVWSDGGTVMVADSDEQRAEPGAATGSVGGASRTVHPRGPR